MRCALEETKPRCLPLAVKTVICTTLTRLAIGALAFHFLPCADSINKPNSGMRHTTDPMGMLGPALCRLCAGCSVCTRVPSAPGDSVWAQEWKALDRMDHDRSGDSGNGRRAPGIAGRTHLRDRSDCVPGGFVYLEIVPRALLLPVLLFHWVRRPGKTSLSWVLGVWHTGLA